MLIVLLRINNRPLLWNRLDTIADVLIKATNVRFINQKQHNTVLVIYNLKTMALLIKGRKQTKEKAKGLSLGVSITNLI